MENLSNGSFRLGLATVSQLALHPEFSEELAACIRREGGSEHAIRAMLREFFPSAPDEPLPEGSIVIPKLIHVDRRKPLADMIREARLDNESDAIEAITEARFPVDCSGIIQGHLVYEKELILLAPYQDGITTKQWWDWMDDHGFVREETPELMALARDFPDYQREFYIRAFGSSWLDSDGNLRSPSLWGGAERRGAGTRWYVADDQWNRHYRALVSRKQRR